jgi:hypothetical protein
VEEHSLEWIILPDPAPSCLNSCIYVSNRNLEVQKGPRSGWSFPISIPMKETKRTTNQIERQKSHRRLPENIFPDCLPTGEQNPCINCNKQ